MGHLGRLLRLRPRRLARPASSSTTSSTTRTGAATTRRPSAITAARRHFPAPSAGCSATSADETGEGPASGFEDVTVKAGLAKAAGPGPGRVLRRLRRRRLAGHLRRQRRQAQPPVDQPEERHLHRGGLAPAASPSIPWAQAQAGMGVAVGDVDGDGLFDVYVTHLTPSATPCGSRAAARPVPRPHRRGRPACTRTGAAPASAPCWPTSTTTAGPTSPSSTARVAQGTHDAQPGAGRALPATTASATSSSATPGKGKFRDVSRRTAPFCGTPNVARGLACGDLDGDGALDLVVTTVAGRARVFRNVARPRGHWLLVRAVDPRLKRDAYGAEVASGPAAGGCCASSTPATATSAAATRGPTSAWARRPATTPSTSCWPDGLAEVFPGGPADRALVLRRGEGKQEPLADFGR